MKGPGQKNDFAKKAKRMKYPNQYDNKDYGKDTKLVARTIDHVDTNTGAFYGTRTIMTKEHQTFSDFLIQEDEDLTLLPDSVIAELKKLIRQGASDLEQKWTNALELTHKAYQVGNVRRPTPTQKGAWKQYEDLIAFAVKQLSANHGINGEWRASDVLYQESAQMPVDDEPMAKHRFFVRIPGEAAVEVLGDTMDNIIDQVTNKLRRHGAVARIEQRSEEGAKLGVYVNGNKRDEVVIQSVS